VTESHFGRALVVLQPLRGRATELGLAEFNYEPIQEGICPACGASGAVSGADCPECGLSLGIPERAEGTSREDEG
jgi:hypothetical protein